MSEPPEHGTTAAYRVHLNRRERPCDACRALNAAMSRERRAQLSACRDCGEVKRIEARGRCIKCYRKVKKRPRKPPMPYARELLPCGTMAAYRRHHKAGEEACPPCHQAMLDYSRQFRSIVAKCAGCGETTTMEARGFCNPCYRLVIKYAPVQSRKKRKTK